MSHRTTIPSAPLPTADILAQLDQMAAGDVDFRGGRTWSLVYPAGDEHEAMLAEASKRFLSANGLNPMAFRSLKRLEREVVEMTAGLLNGPASTVGTMTSGGTESIMLSAKAWRDRLRRKKPWVRQAEIVAPETAHPAFDKAAHYLDMKLRLAPVGPDFRVDARALTRLINGSTAFVVASAPSYPQGVIDPIEAIAEQCLAKGTPLHVDACVGGFVLPWLEKLGHHVRPWDFRLPGVRSISADVHKYGYAPKGASTLLFRDMADMRHQFFISTRWSGGIYASATLPGSRPGAPIAAAWASLQGLGEEGFLRLASQALDAARRLRAGIATIDGVCVLGAFDATIVTWGSNDPAVDVYAVADQLAAAGWSVDRQQRPACVHLTVNASNAPVVDQYVADLRAAVARVRADPSLKSSGEAATYGLAARVPIAALAGPAVLQAMERLYGTDPDAPVTNAEPSALERRALLLLQRFDRFRR